MIDIRTYESRTFQLSTSFQAPTMTRGTFGYRNPLLLPDEEATKLSITNVLKIEAGILAGSIALAMVFRFSIDFPTVALVAASVGLVVALKLGLSDRQRRWGVFAATLFSVASGFAYLLHVDGRVAWERQVALGEQLAKEAHEAAQLQREAQKQAILESAAREEQRMQEAAEEAERVAQAKRGTADLAALRRSNPEQYLERIKTTDRGLWAKEAKVLRPKLYVAYLEEQRVQQAAIEYQQQKRSPLDHLKLEMTWARGGLDGALTATFIITNALPFSVRNVLIQCDGRAGADTATWTKAITLHDIVPPRSTKRLANIKMGPVPREMSQLVCRLAGVQ